MNSLVRSTHLSSIITTLSIQSLHEGDGCWFQVVSGSMAPLLKKGDEIYITPCSGNEICLGEIAAFETQRGLVVHRIISVQKMTSSGRLLQMADIELHARWISTSAVVGKVVALRRGTELRSFQDPFARYWNRVIAYLRFHLYRLRCSLPRGVLPICDIPLHSASRLIVYLVYLLNKTGYSKI